MSSSAVTSPSAVILLAMWFTTETVTEREVHFSSAVTGFFSAVILLGIWFTTETIHATMTRYLAHLTTVTFTKER